MKLNKLKEIICKNKFAVLILVAGVALLLIPIGGMGSKPQESAPPSTEISAPVFEIEAQEKRLSDAVSKIEGAGRVKVLLSADGSVSRSLAENGEETLVLSGGSGGEGVVELRYAYPSYIGAVVVCDGADSPASRLEITQAVMTFTGLKSDKISVIKMRE